ncbi:MAG TPA: glycosyltransferase family 39 protein [Elusimicrobiota bacterium]|nr:glycosyltransferase family 39 protein [Elusimicrobiota bacterium]
MRATSTSSSRRRPPDGPAALLAAALLLFVLAGARVLGDYGPNIDAPKNWAEGRANLGVLLGRTPDPATAREQLHGAPVFMLAELSRAIFSDRLGLLDPVSARHALLIPLNAAFAVFLFLFARRHWGGWTALLAALALLSFPEYFGFSFNNLKDVPLVVLFSLAVMKGAERRTRRDLYVFHALLGAALCVKMYALLVPAILLARRDRKPLGTAAGGALTLGLVLAFYAPAWWATPDKRALLASWFGHASAVSVNPKGGWNLASFQQLAWKCPLWMLACAAAGTWTSLRRARKDPQDALLISWFFLPMLLPCLPGVYPYFPGLRLVLVACVPLAILAARGAFQLAEAAARRAPKQLRALRLAAGLGLVAANVCALSATHPYQTLYYNFLAGGLGVAQAKGIPWSFDYWLNSYREAGRWLDANAAPDAEVWEAYDAAIPERFKGLLRYSVSRRDLRIRYKDFSKEAPATLPPNTYLVFVPFSWYREEQRVLEGNVRAGRLERALEITRSGGEIATIYRRP